MENSLIKKNYKKKIKLIKKYNKLYYDRSDPSVSDQEYDKLKKDIINIEEKYPELINKNSPSQSVGFKPSKNFKKIKHKVRMLSLSNAFGDEDLKNFEKKIINFLSLNQNIEIEYSTEPKIDGISASIKYENGMSISGIAVSLESIKKSSLSKEIRYSRLSPFPSSDVSNLSNSDWLSLFGSINN